MVALFAVISTVRFTDQFVNKVIDSAFFFGALLSVLAVFFSEPYHGVYTARLTLTIAGIQMDPNDLSAFFLFCFVVALYRIIMKKDSFFLNVSILIISTIASGMTASRGGLVSYIVVVIVMTFVSGMKRRSFLGSLKRIATVSLILTMLYFVLTYILPKESFERLFVNAYESGSGRLDIWRESVFAFTANPLVGYGWGGSYYRVHNTYLNILVDNGLVGLLLFLSFLFLLVLKAMRAENALAVCIIFAGITPAFFIEAITKRFFWNALIIGVLLINRLESNSIEHKSVKTDNLQSNNSPLRNLTSDRETAHCERRLQ